MKKELADLYLNYLSEQGYRPELDADGDVKFKKEGKTFYILDNTSEKPYFQLAYPNFWKIESPEERDWALQASASVTHDTRVAKVTVNAEHTNVWATVELFLEKPEDFKPVFERCAGALMYSINSFAEKMREMKKKTASASQKIAAQ